ncbi:beta strand repeat-containing protein [Pseudocnuella soli]|uniref:beta strand repeat-containing protein n=1 Tax=Pseudocnuella soli TaxID=2502779 RepID=UPI00104D94F4|nr:T9SS type A sorting domain-containing protein [Pseudocnuella soli]
MRKFTFCVLWLLFTSLAAIGQTTLVSFSSTWKYLEDGSKPKGDWKAGTYNDANWKTGKGAFGYNAPGLNTIVSYGNDKKNKHVVTYFRKIINISDPAMYQEFSAQIVRREINGVAVFVNGEEVYRKTVSNGGGNGKGDEEDAGRILTEQFAINKMLLRKGDNIIAVEVTLKSKRTSSMIFDLQMTAKLAPPPVNTPPAVLSINRQNPTGQLTNATSVTFRINFSEAVSGVDAADFTVKTVSGNATGTPTSVVAVGSDGKTYDITVGSVSGSGTLRLDLNSSGTGIKDAGGAALPGGFTNGQTYTVDLSAPAATSINRGEPASETTTVTQVSFNVVFSEKVTGVDATDFTIAGTATGVIGANAVTPVGSEGTTYKVVVSQITGTGTLRLDLKGAGTGITDAAGNAISGGFNSGQSYTIVAADVTPPVVSGIVRQSPLEQNTSATTVSFGVTFSEGVSGVDATDFTLSTGGTAQGSIQSVSGSGSSYVVTVGSISGSGSLGLSVKASGTGITDGAGNGLSGGFSGGETYNVSPADVTAPTVTSINRQTPADETTNANSVIFGVTFSEPVTGVDVSDFSLTAGGTVQGTVANVSGSGTSYAVTVNNISGSGTLRLDVKASGTGITDGAGNAISGGFTGGQTYNINPPQTVYGFSSVTPLSNIPINGDTQAKPQGKTWFYAGKWWTVISPAEGGTRLYRLDGTTWTDVRTIFNLGGRADTWVTGNLVHVLLYRGTTASQLITLDYNAATETYVPWAQRPGTTPITLPAGSETATLTIDGAGRIWMAAAGTTEVYVWYTDAPYTVWSAPITLATGINDDDICAITRLPGKIGLLWSNQTTGRFGFRTHVDGTDPTVWTADEIPAQQSLIPGSIEMADDHLNIVVAADGTLYAAVKTGYDLADGANLPLLGLLVRRPNGNWDPLYTVTTTSEGGGGSADNSGTQAIALLNETLGKIKVVYTTVSNGGSIVYKESPIAAISFGQAKTLIEATGTLYNFASSTHQAYHPEVVIVATKLNTSPAANEVVSVLASDAPIILPGMGQRSTPPMVMRADNLQTNNAAGEVQAYPVPARRGVAITVRAGGNGIAEALLSDAGGRIVTRMRFTGTTTLSTSNLNSGVYTLTVVEQGKKQTRKVMITE